MKLFLKCGKEADSICSTAPTLPKATGAWTWYQGHVLNLGKRTKPLRAKLLRAKLVAQIWRKAPPMSLFQKKKKEDKVIARAVGSISQILTKNAVELALPVSFVNEDSSECKPGNFTVTATSTQSILTVRLRAHTCFGPPDYVEKQIVTSPKLDIIAWPSAYHEELNPLVSVELAAAHAFQRSHGGLAKAYRQKVAADVSADCLPKAGDVDGDVVGFGTTARPKRCAAAKQSVTTTTTAQRRAPRATLAKKLQAKKSTSRGKAKTATIKRSATTTTAKPKKRELPTDPQERLKLWRQIQLKKYLDNPTRVDYYFPSYGAMEKEVRS